MRVENAFRWQRMWWFLSLDFLQDFCEDLWLPLLDNTLQEHLQKKIDPERDLPSFGRDPRVRSYRMLTSFRDVFGAESLGYLCEWQRFVFGQGGDDRVEEFVWRILAYELNERANELKLKEEFRSTLQEFHVLSAMRQSELKKRTSRASEKSLSTWDQKAIAAEGESLENVLNLVMNICSSNTFVMTWHETCTTRGSTFLEGLFEIALRVAAEDTSGRLIFSSDTLPFPSSWEFDLQNSLLV